MGVSCAVAHRFHAMLHQLFKAGWVLSCVIALHGTSLNHKSIEKHTSSQSAWSIQSEYRDLALTWHHGSKGYPSFTNPQPEPPPP